jgi:hypothetical protein
VMTPPCGCLIVGKHLTQVAWQADQTVTSSSSGWHYQTQKKDSATKKKGISNLHLVPPPPTHPMGSHGASGPSHSIPSGSFSTSGAPGPSGPAQPGSPSPTGAKGH